MADYWKSNPRKRCDFCDCWIADNRASIDFHERGKRHKENVEKKISELRKKGQEQYKQQQALAGSLQKMEEDAMKKFQQDIANDPELAAKYKAMQEKADAIKATTALKEENSKPPKDDTASTSNNVDEQEQEHHPVWYEGTGPDGRTYYWNSRTQESQWKKPPDFDGEPDQQDTNISETDSKTNIETSSHSNDSDEDDSDESSGESSSEEEKDDADEIADRRPEKRKASAYGTWTTIEKEEQVDLELPENRRIHQIYVPKAAQTQPREKLKFKERTVASLGTTSGSESVNVGFKKRKFGGNVRKRDTSA